MLLFAVFCIFIFVFPVIVTSRALQGTKFILNLILGFSESHFKTSFSLTPKVNFSGLSSCFFFFCVVSQN